MLKESYFCGCYRAPEPRGRIFEKSIEFLGSIDKKIQSRDEIIDIIEQ